MEKIIVLTCLFAASTAIFFPFINLPNQQKSMMNICIYSVNPARYQPKCFLCPSTVYQNVLRACVNAATIPSNITFTQASCIEQNCAIGRGKRSVDVQQPDNLLEEFESQKLINQQDNAIDQEKGDEPSKENHNNPHVIGTEEFIASDYVDYEESADDFDSDD